MLDDQNRTIAQLKRELAALQEEHAASDEGLAAALDDLKVRGSRCAGLSVLPSLTPQQCERDKVVGQLEDCAARLLDETTRMQLQLNYEWDCALTCSRACAGREKVEAELTAVRARYAELESRIRGIEANADSLVEARTVIQKLQSDLTAARGRESNSQAKLDAAINDLNLARAHHLEASCLGFTV